VAQDARNFLSAPCGDLQDLGGYKEIRVTTAAVPLIKVTICYRSCDAAAFEEAI
jgi:hypothetical protein